MVVREQTYQMSKFYTYNCALLVKVIRVSFTCTKKNNALYD